MKNATSNASLLRAAKFLSDNSFEFGLQTARAHRMAVTRAAKQLGVTFEEARDEAIAMAKADLDAPSA